MLHLRSVMIRVVIKGLGGRFSDFKMGHGSLKFENSCAALWGKTLSISSVKQHVWVYVHTSIHALPLILNRVGGGRLALCD